jgi:hypothetical protein
MTIISEGISTGSSLPSASAAPTRDRLFDSDVSVRKVPLPFKNKNYDILVATTAYGDFLYGGTGGVMLARNCNETSARRYITETVNRIPSLNHNDVSIIDHLQVCNCIHFSKDNIPVSNLYHSFSWNYIIILILFGNRISSSFPTNIKGMFSLPMRG